MSPITEPLEKRQLLSVAADNSTLLLGSNTSASGTLVLNWNVTGTAAAIFGTMLLRPIHVTSRGTLVIQTGGGNDSVHVDRKAGSLVVTAKLGAEHANFITQIPVKQVKRINIFTDGGRDEIRLGATVTKRATLTGGGGNDTIVGGAGPETISGGAGNDVIDAGPAGPAGSQTVVLASQSAGVVPDNLLPAPGAVMFGGTGDDTIIGSGANDHVSGGAGTDTFRTNAFTGGNVVGIDVFVSKSTGRVVHLIEVPA